MYRTMGLGTIQMHLIRPLRRCTQWNSSQRKMDKLVGEREIESEVWVGLVGIFRISLTIRMRSTILFIPAVTGAVFAFYLLFEALHTCRRCCYIADSAVKYTLVVWCTHSLIYSQSSRILWCKTVWCFSWVRSSLSSFPSHQGHAHPFSVLAV